MAQVNVTEAARLVGKNRKTLYKMMDKGTVAYTQSATGMRQLETSELIRVFGSLVSPDLSPNMDKDGQEATVNLSHNVALLEQKVVFLEDKLKDKDTHIALLSYTKKEKSKTWVWVVLAVIISVLATNLAYRIPNPF
jgi:hypothetical protein